MKKTLITIAVCLVIGFVVTYFVIPHLAFGASTFKIDNPLQKDSIQDLIAQALQFVSNLLAVAGVVYIIWTGFLFVKAQGNDKELQTAKKSFFNAIVGMAIILGAWALAQMLANTLKSVTKADITIGTK